MSGNSIAISRELVAAGVEEKTANAVAEAIVKNSDTKVEILELKADLRGEINALRNQLNVFQAESKEVEKKNDMRFNFIIGLLIALCAGVFVILLQLPFGS